MHPQPDTIPMGLTPPKPHPVARRLPRHIGLMAYGQARWAQQTGLPHAVAATAAVQRALEVTDFCVQQRIEALVLHIFPSDIGGLASKAEQNILSLLLRQLEGGAKTLRAWRIRLHVAGDITALPDALGQLLLDTEAQTRHNQALNLTISLNGALLSGTHKACDARHHPAVPRQPDPDLVIRTGNGLPLGQTFLWDTSRTALYYTGTLWPDFDTRCLARALQWFSQDNRPVGTQAVTS